MPASLSRTTSRGRSDFIGSDPEHRRRHLQYVFGAVFDGHEIVAESRAMRAVMVAVDAIARCDFADLDTGARQRPDRVAGTVHRMLQDSPKWWKCHSYFRWYGTCERTAGQHHGGDS